MKIRWNPSDELKKRAIKISELKENLTYEQLEKTFGLHFTYLIELKKLGDQLRKDKHD